MIRVTNVPFSVPKMRMRRKLKKKSREEGDTNDSSSINHLPDEIILQILNKLIDLKTLCCCHLVSRRFSSIVLQVDAISITVQWTNPRIPDTNTDGDVLPSRSIISFINSESFLLSVFPFLRKFKGLKSLYIELPSSREIGIDIPPCLFKWMVKFGDKIQSFMCLWPNSISDKDGLYLSGNGDNDEEDINLANDVLKQKFVISVEYLRDVILWHMMLLSFVEFLPTLEKVSITDSGRRGRLSLSGEKLSQLKKMESAHSTSKTLLDCLEVPNMSICYIPVLKLPVSGYVMKGAYLVAVGVKDHQGGNDFLMNNEDGFQDKEEAAYAEAVMEILEKHRGMMRMLTNE